MSAGSQQLITCRDFDQDRDAAARGDRHPDQRNSQAEDLEELVVQPEPLVLARRIPPLELHDELHALR